MNSILNLPDSTDTKSGADLISRFIYVVMIRHQLPYQCACRVSAVADSPRQVLASAPTRYLIRTVPGRAPKSAHFDWFECFPPVNRCNGITIDYGTPVTTKKKKIVTGHVLTTQAGGTARLKLYAAWELLRQSRARKRSSRVSYSTESGLHMVL